jgi:transcriptional regulator
MRRSAGSLLDGKGETEYSPFPDRREPLTKPVELPQGALEMLVLKAVSLGPLHGYGILLRIQQVSGERLEILQGSFYSAIYRLERRGWIKGKWGGSENNRRARFYSVTAAGTRQLKTETARWTDMAAVVAGILDKKAGEL